MTYNYTPHYCPIAASVIDLLVNQSIKSFQSIININAVTIDPVTVKIANCILIRQPEQ